MNVRCRSHPVIPLPKPSTGFLLLLEKSRFSVSRALGIWPCPPFRLHTPSSSPATPCAPAALPFLWLHKHTKLTFSGASHLPPPRPPTLFPGCPHGCHVLITGVSAETSPSQRLPWPLPELTLSTASSSTLTLPIFIFFTSGNYLTDLFVGLLISSSPACHPHWDNQIQENRIYT